MRRRELIKLFVGAAVAWPLAAHARPSARTQARQLSLTSAQRAAIWRSLGKEAMRTQIPAGLNIGESAPDTMHLLPFDRRLSRKIPALRHHGYALVHGQVLVIEPGTKKIVAVVGE